jgi:hypothetical protein
MAETGSSVVLSLQPPIHYANTRYIIEQQMQAETTLQQSLTNTITKVLKINM